MTRRGSGAPSSNFAEIRSRVPIKGNTVSLRKCFISAHYINSRKEIRFSTQRSRLTHTNTCTLLFPHVLVYERLRAMRAERRTPVVGVDVGPALADTDCRRRRGCGVSTTRGDVDDSTVAVDRILWSWLSGDRTEERRFFPCFGGGVPMVEMDDFEPSSTSWVGLTTTRPITLD